MPLCFTWINLSSFGDMLYYRIYYYVIGYIIECSDVVLSQFFDDTNTDKVHVLSFSQVRPSMLESTALGAAMAAGMAEGINIWKMSEDKVNDNLTADTFVPSIPESGEQI